MKLVKTLQIIGLIAVIAGCIFIVITADEPLDIYQKRPMPPLELNGLDGNEVNTSQWALESNGPKAINLFATWCAPCAVEMPIIAKLADHVPVYGIAWRDSPEELNSWLAKHGNPFKQVGIDKAFTFMFDLGINGVPTTLLLDESQRIVHIHKGTISEADIERYFLPKIKEIEDRMEQGL